MGHKIWNSRTGTWSGPPKSARGVASKLGFASSVAFHPDGIAHGLDRPRSASKGLGLDDRPRGVRRPVRQRPDGWDRICRGVQSPRPNQLAAGSDGAVTIWDWRNKQHVHTFPDTKPSGSAWPSVATGGAWPRGLGREREALGRQAGGEPLCTFTEIAHLPSPRWRSARTVVGWPRPVSTAVWTCGIRRPASSLTRFRIADSFWLCVQSGRPAHRLDGRRQDGTCLGGRERPGGARPWRTQRLVRVRGFSPDGLRLASASMDGTIRVWDATPLQGHEGQETLTLPDHGGEIWSLAVSPDGRKIALAGFGNPAKVWDVETRPGNRQLTGHRDVVFCVAWHPDGQRIAVAGGNGDRFTVEVWDPQTGQKDSLPASGLEIRSPRHSATRRPLPGHG